MPSWKKVIVSGSDATLNSLNVTNGLTVTGSSNLSGSFIVTGSVSATSFTGSLLGTASYANNANSASYTFNSTSASYAATASSADQFNVRTALTASGLIYPTVDGLENQVLETDGNGNLIFDDIHTMLEEVHSGEAITKGDPLYISGSQGASPIVYRADAADPTKMPVTYIAAETIGANNGTRGIILGLIEGINLTGYPAGTEVYVAAGGGWTSTRPTGSAIVQVLGVVTKEGTGGKGLVLNPGPANLPNLQSGSLWVGNSSGIPTAIPTSSIQNVVSSSYATTASYALNTTSASYAFNSTSASYASTASSADNFTVRGTLTAQTIVAQTITSSVEYVTGSTVFGSQLSNTHQFTGSVSITGSLAVKNIPQGTTETDILVIDGSGNFKYKGITGAQGTQGTQGITGAQGIQGITGAQGTQGTQGITGAQGTQGTQGITGAQGTQGIQGITGAQGTQGIQGITGAQGIQGITGAQGTQGTQGITGAQGIQGITGAQGTQGTQGIQGITGAQGTQGTQGITGAQGIQGITGAQGTQGTQGIQGITGAQGTQGTQGITGAQGIQGITGAQGTQGIQGIQGITGTQGTQGIQGITGAQGTQGIQGITGAQGTQGIQGITGAQGTQGIQGITGTQGTQGIQGIQGTQGTQGIQGTQGTQGTQGIQGTQGTQGTQGAQGTQGIQGTQGTQGTQGIQGSAANSITNNTDNYIVTATGNSATPFNGEANLTFNGSLLNVTGDITATGTITAQTLVVQTITSSVSVVTGSTQFGSLTSNTHQFTGSILQSGSLAYFAGSVGIGTVSPAYKLDVVGGTANNQIARFIAADYPAHSIGLGIEAIGSNWGASIFQDDVRRFTVEENGGILVGSSYQSSNAPADGAIIQGNVGIGTTSPTTRLHIVQSTSFDGIRIVSSNGTTQNTLALYHNDSYAVVETTYLGSGAFKALCLNTQGGNVGIGTTSPAQKLSISNGASTAYIQLIGQSRNLYLGQDGTGAAIYSDGNAPMYFSVSGSEKMRITSAGTILVNTTTDYAGYLQVNGQFTTIRSSGNAWVNYTNTTGDNQYAFLQAVTNGYLLSVGKNGSSAAPYLAFGVADGEHMRINTAGNVGIGTTSPSSLLSVQGNTDLGNSYGSTTSSTYTTRISGYAMRYDASNRYGNYGLLILNADSGWTASARRFMLTNGLSTNKFAIIRSVDSTTDPSFGDGGVISSGTADFVIDNGGNIGMGITTPSTKLHIYDSSATNMISVQNSGGGGASTIGNDSSGNLYIKPPSNIYFQALSGTNSTIIGTAGQIILNSSSNTTFTGAGNVGIGTTSPPSKFTVSNAGAEGIELKPADSAGVSRILFFNRNDSTRDDAQYDALTHQFQVNAGTEAMRITSGGVVSIATISPYTSLSTRLYVGYDQNSSVAVRDEFISVGAAGGSTNIAGVNFLIYNGGYGGRIFTDDRDGSYRGLVFDVLQNGTFYTAMSITRTTSPNIGIGTTSPSYKLDVDGIIRSSDSAYFATSTGNVGIGTTTTYGKLQVAASTTDTTNYYGSARIVIQQTSNTANNFANLSFLSQGGSDAAAIWTQISSHTNGATSGNLVLGTTDSAGASTARITILSGGSVGIGTTSPTTKLDVNGASTFRAASGTSQVNIAEFINSTNNGYMSVSAAGTTSAVGTWGNGSQIIEFVPYSTGDGIISAYTGNLLFQTNSRTNRMVITSGGNVGIGTTAPTATLQVGLQTVNAASLRIGQYTTTNNSYGDWVGMEFMMSNEVSQFTGNPAARIATYLEGDNNRFGLRFWTRTSAGDFSEKMRIAAEGNVGIGTTSPAAKLDVNGDLIARNTISSTSGTVTNILSWTATAGVVGTTTNHGLQIRTNDTTKVFIDAGGNVGIGTTSPYSKFTVYGALSTSTSQISIVNSEGGHAIIRSGLSGISNNGISFVLANTDGSGQSVPMVINASSNVGIGSTSPTAKLDVNGDVNIGGLNIVGAVGGGPSLTATFKPVNASSVNTGYDFQINPAGGAYGYLSVRNVDSGVNQTLLQISAQNLAGDSWINVPNTSQNISLRVNNSTKFYLQGSSGNVGIGTTSPGYKLTVNGGTSGSSGVIARFTDTNNSQRLDIIDEGSSAGQGAGITNGTGYGVRIWASGGPVSFTTGAGSTERMRVDTGGNVGIGSTGPAYALDVSGTIRATGDVIAYSDARVKENVETISDALAKVTSLRGVSYTRKDSEDKSRKVGVIAQEVLDVLPEVVQQDTEGNYSVAYGNVVGVLIEAIKELKAEIDILKQK